MATFKGKKNEILAGTTEDDTFNSGGGAGTITGGGGNDTYIFAAKNDASVVTGGEGSDTFIIKTSKVADGFTIDGGTSSKDNSGNTATKTQVASQTSGTIADAVLAPIDARLDLVYRPAPNATALSTNSSSYSATPNATDTIQFTKSGDFTNMSFTHIEKIKLASGVSIKITADQLEAATTSNDLGAINSAVQFEGVAGGKTEKVTILVEYEDTAFYSTTTKSSYAYTWADFQLDDFTVANIAKNVTMLYDLASESKVLAAALEDDEEDAGGAEESLGSSGKIYGRVDGTNANEYVLGSYGVDNATMRLGNDTYFGFDGNDLIIGHGGADYLDGGNGNDIFTIGGFGVNGQHSGTPGANNPFQGLTSKADDGNPEWITDDNAKINGVDQYGGKRDVIVGGAGRDTLRITSGQGIDNAKNAADASDNVVLKLTDANFKGMEVVQVGANVGRINTEDSALQLLNDHLYLNSGASETGVSATATDTGKSLNNLTVDASGVTKNGLLFEGNGNDNNFIGTAKGDTFIGNGGHDTLTGGGGKDVFQFGSVHTMTVGSDSTSAGNSATTTGQSFYYDKITAFTAAMYDTITDFTAGSDKIALNRDFFTKFGTSTKVAPTAANIVQGAGTTAAADADDYLIFNSTDGKLYYDADGSGAGASVLVAELQHVTSVSASDFVIV